MMEIRTEITANVWVVKVEPGQLVEAGDELVILESMKMELPVEAPVSGRVVTLEVQPEDHVTEGDLIATIEP